MRQIFLLLFLIPEELYRLAAKAQMGSNQCRKAAVGSREFLDYARERELVNSHATVFCRNRGSEIPELGQLGKELDRYALLIEFPGYGKYTLLAEFPR